MELCKRQSVYPVKCRWWMSVFLHWGQFNWVYLLEGEDEEFGITDFLLDFVTTFTVDTFKSYPLNLNQGDPTAEGDRTGGAGNVRTDLTQWQQQHALHILSKAKEISKLRYDLCPRHMKDKQFWNIYFLLVKTHIAP
ncbi:BSD domain containing protein [Rhynchospora pubera]|uniref:BSD domain containing protein n=1 Tax=Rhynchospora pubera TaxID=906938 RepID=A0AAV8GWJ4_9POAL|nr:BSD domain containing protein [Rhynchospora pubera]